MQTKYAKTIDLNIFNTFWFSLFLFRCEKVTSLTCAWCLLFKVCIIQE